MMEESMKHSLNDNKNKLALNLQRILRISNGSLINGDGKGKEREGREVERSLG